MKKTPVPRQKLAMQRSDWSRAAQRFTVSPESLFFYTQGILFFSFFIGGGRGYSLFHLFFPLEITFLPIATTSFILLVWCGRVYLNKNNMQKECSDGSFSTKIILIGFILSLCNKQNLFTTPETRGISTGPASSQYYGNFAIQQW